jgi:ABC-type transport system involved in cytochrome c biogenesis ATPase subunit
MNQDGKREMRRLSRIYIRRLFGLYTHEISFFLDQRVTIIHGANGVGKTTILKLINAIFKNDLPFLFSVPFDDIEIKMNDGSKLALERISASSAVTAESSAELSGSLRFLYSDAEQFMPNEVLITAGTLNLTDWAVQYLSGNPWLNRVGQDKWFDQRADSYHSALDLWNLNHADPNRVLPNLTMLLPEPFRNFTASVRTFFVEAQRLIRLSHRKRGWSTYEGMNFTSAVAHDAFELAGRVKDAFAQYGQISQKLDQTFPQRFFEFGRKRLDKKEITDAIRNLESERSRLQNAGILDEAAPYPFDVSKIDVGDATQIGAMSLYIEDSQKKLGVLSSLSARLEALLSSMNSKFINKVARFDRERGLVATIEDGGELRADQLSSGEQHEIVLLYTLLFKISENTLVLIDEPELSLHVEWKRRFLPELLAIAASTRIDALVATHSPSIIGDRFDLMVGLEAEVDRSLSH